MLVRALARFVGSALEQGEAAVVIAAAKRIAALTKRLIETGYDVASTNGQGAFVTLDAERCLATFMADGVSDRAVFRSVVTPVLDRLRDAGYKKIRLFGEMVNVLWPHTSDAATGRLEELWNERIADYELCLLCAYHVDPVDVELRRGICYKVLPVPEPSNHQA